MKNHSKAFGRLHVFDLFLVRVSHSLNKSADKIISILTSPVTSVTHLINYITIIDEVNSSL